MKQINTLAFIILGTIALSGCSTFSGKSAENEQPVNDQLIPETELITTQILLTFEKGDTLWEFAERNTGNGDNWEQIMLANGIEDEKNIDAGAELMVPYNLAVDSLKNQ